MACGSCGSKKAKTTYVHTDSSGNTKTYSSEVEARAAVARKGGTYKAQ